MKRFLTLAFCALALAACASAPPEYGTDYMVEVTNPMPHAMNVTAEIGAAEETVLGKLAPGETRRFEIRNPQTNDIIIKAVNENLTQQIEKEVELERGTIAKVTIDD